MSDQVFSTYQVAKLCNVHHTTVIKWVNEGILKAYTTPGGHRRIKKEDLLEFIIQHQMPIPDQMSKISKNVLIVDDDIEVLEEYRDALGGNGFDLDCVSDGFEAGVKIYRENPDLILLDFRMPGMDGFQICEILQRDKKTAQIPVIAITVLSSDEDVKRIKASGIRKYMVKPVDMDKLLTLIKEILKI
ncbi:MAG: response regulator [Candidatus Saelkia tenebricola]|nr:response regulator [Candidatus Saelkia tenebricola]